MAPQKKKKSNIFKKVGQGIGNFVKGAIKAVTTKPTNLGANVSGSLQQSVSAPNFSNIGSKIKQNINQTKSNIQSTPVPTIGGKTSGGMSIAPKGTTISGGKAKPGDYPMSYIPGTEGGMSFVPPSTSSGTNMSIAPNMTEVPKGGKTTNNGTPTQIIDPTTAFFDTFGQQNEPTYKSSQAIAGTEMNSTTPSLPTTDTKGKIDFPAITKDLESLYNYDTQSAETAQQEIDKIMKNLEKKIPNNEQIYNDALAQSGKEEAQKLFNEKQAQLSAITAKANADKLSLIGQGRGIPEAIIGGQQAQIDREAAIRALPVAAELEAAKGNLEMATENLNTLYKIKSEDASNKYAFKVKVADYAIQFATKEQAKKIEYLKAAYKEQTDREQENIAQLNKLAIELAKNGKPFTFLKNIDTKDSNAVFTAIQMAGNSLMDVKSSGSSSNYYTVQPGDTGRTIAAKLGLTWEALDQLNPGVDWNNLRPGVQKLNTDTGDLKQTTTPEIGALSPANLAAGVNYMINHGATPEELEAFKTDREVQAYILQKIQEEN